MNDFLQSLRNPNTRPEKKRMTRKAQDYDYHSENQQFQYYNGYYNNDVPAAQNSLIGQAAPQGEDHNITSLLLTTIESLTRQVETLASTQGHLVAAQERTASVIGRQTRAIEKISNHIDAVPKNWLRKMR